MHNWIALLEQIGSNNYFQNKFVRMQWTHWDCKKCWTKNEQTKPNWTKTSRTTYRKIGNWNECSHFDVLESRQIYNTSGIRRIDSSYFQTCTVHQVANNLFWKFQEMHSIPPPPSTNIFWSQHMSPRIYYRQKQTLLQTARLLATECDDQIKRTKMNTTWWDMVLISGSRVSSVLDFNF